MTDDISSRTRHWDLGDGAVVSISLPRRMSKRQFDRLKRYMAALEMEEQIVWDIELQEAVDA